MKPQLSMFWEWAETTVWILYPQLAENLAQSSFPLCPIPPDFCHMKIRAWFLFIKEYVKSKSDFIYVLYFLIFKVLVYQSHFI